MSIETRQAWYEGITRYQWLVLAIACLGWIFDVFEGQIFVASMNEAMPSLFPEAVKAFTPEVQEGYKQFYILVTFGAFLVGGALGGVIFGMMSDRIGRKKAMTYTILMYSVFTFVSALSVAWWHMAVTRFLVAMGVGGEWAVASALVAEVFPKRARAKVLSIFHASSILGTYLAIAAGQFVVNNPAFESETYPSLSWRFGFLVGVLPALLIIWVRMSLKEPPSWEQAKTSAMQDVSQKMGSFSGLFASDVRRNTLVGVSLASIGMATFWGVHVFGKDLVRNEVERGYFGNQPDPSKAAEVEKAYDEAVRDYKTQHAGEAISETLEATLQEVRGKLGSVGLLGVRTELPPGGLTREGTPNSSNPFQQLDPPQVEVIKQLLTATKKPFKQRIKSWEMLAMFLTSTGGGLGLLAFGPVSDRIGRRRTFVFYHVGGLVVALITLRLPMEITWMLAVLPVFGFLTLGMHAGYAVYFPELFPTRLRGTGGGFCFNFGRFVAAPILFLAGWMQKDWGFNLRDTASLLSLLYLLGVVVIWFAIETRDEELPD
ncbi:MAG: MFS transporter [Pirellulaceae bacterium]